MVGGTVGIVGADGAVVVVVAVVTVVDGAARWIGSNRIVEWW